MRRRPGRNPGYVPVSWVSLRVLRSWSNLSQKLIFFFKITKFKKIVIANHKIKWSKSVEFFLSRSFFCGGGGFQRPGRALLRHRPPPSGRNPGYVPARGVGSYSIGASSPPTHTHTGESRVGAAGAAASPQAPGSWGRAVFWPPPNFRILLIAPRPIIAAGSRSRALPVANAAQPSR